MLKSLLYTALFLFCSVSAGFAMDGCGAGSCTDCHSLTLGEANELLAGVGQVKKVGAAPVSGLWLLELERDGKQGVVFLDFGKKNLIAGTVFPLAPKDTAGQGLRQPAPAKPPVTAVDVASIPLENSIVMGNPKGKKRLFVFTDPDCPFCGKLHAELKKLTAMDGELAVHVKMFPLKMHPKAYDKARVLLGARSPEMLDSAFAGATLPAPGEKDLKGPVDETIGLAEALGVDSTPTLVLPDGGLVVGFREAAALKEMMSGKGGK